MTTGKLSVHIQPACAEHRYIRDKDLSNIVERPERLRALAVGIAAAIALAEGSKGGTHGDTVDPEHLAQSMSNLKVESGLDVPHSTSALAHIVRHPVPLDTSFLNNPAVRMIHALEEDTSVGSGEEYLTQLSRWVSESEARVKAGESEIPDGEGLSQGDLYLCSRTLLAISGALQTTCNAVDSVFTSPNPRAFVAIRPPGHHCGSDEPAGFCWVNNVLVGAAHAYHAHGIDRAVIFDIDLHHGNGTQSITWKLNAETRRKSLEAAAQRAAGILDNDTPGTNEGLQIYYGSLHDILSYPCEDGDVAITAAASVSLSAHGQHIENVHLQEWADENDFFNRLYGDANSDIGDGYATRLFGRARTFLKNTGAVPEKTMIYVSCGFDAGEYEYESMSRHNRRVPTTFYDRFARDAREFADKHAAGRVLGVLEGGYSDRALVAGGMAWTTGMMDVPANKDWWSVKNLEKIEAVTVSMKRKPRASVPTSNATTSISEPWITRALSLLPTLDATFGVVPVPAPRTRRKAEPVPAGAKMTLRDRSKKKQASPGIDDAGSTKTKSTPSSPSKTAKPPSSVKVASPKTSSNVAVPLLGEVFEADSGHVASASRTDRISGVDEAVSALESLSLDQAQDEPSSVLSQQEKKQLLIKLRRSKAPQVEQNVQ